jgi:hypothetical protein
VFNKKKKKKDDLLLLIFDPAETHHLIGQISTQRAFAKCTTTVELAATSSVRLNLSSLIDLPRSHVHRNSVHVYHNHRAWFAFNGFHLPPLASGMHPYFPVLTSKSPQGMLDGTGQILTLNPIPVGTFYSLANDAVTYWLGSIWSS